jgi:pimeloyl-ACP methyl ester carboxylesterase
MTAIKANGVTIAYEEMGSPDAPVIPLIMGLGMQLIVLHGSHDPLVPLAGGGDTAANIPGARLRVPGMGYALPEALIPLLVDEIAGRCLKVENATQMRRAHAQRSSS